MKIKTTQFNKKISFWLLNCKWLWFPTKVSFVTWDSWGIDKTIKHHKGYKHFIFRGCIACDLMIKEKDILLRYWFLKHKEEIKNLKN